MIKWKLQPQEGEGTYRFSGRFVATRGVTELLSEAEIMILYWTVRYLVEQNDGIDYLVVFVHEETYQTLYLIDQLNEEMKPDHPKEHDYCPLLLKEEY